MLQSEKNSIKYDPKKTYWVAGSRSAWDTVVIGLYETKEAVKADWPQHPNCARPATDKEVKEFFNL